MPNALIALAALAFAATPALADTGPRGQSAPTARVSVADLNLASPADRRVLDRRIGSAANAVCPPLIQTGRLNRSVTGLRCRADTLARAQPQRTAAVTRAGASTVTAGSR
jgi:UrcA family protein